MSNFVPGRPREAARGVPESYSMDEKSLEVVCSVQKMVEQSPDSAGRSSLEDWPQVRLVNFSPRVLVCQATGARLEKLAGATVANSSNSEMHVET